MKLGLQIPYFTWPSGPPAIGGKLGDIAPTLLPLVGLEVPPDMSGDDLRAAGMLPSPVRAG